MAHREIKNIDKTILDNFYKLVHTHENIRLTAASSTFKILNALKKTKTEKFNVNLNYCVDRLVAGLSSSRACARRGYGTLLIEILKSYQVSTERLFTIAQQKFGHISKESTADCLIGYFLLSIIILSTGNSKRSKANQQYLENIYRCLSQIKSTKSYFDYSVSMIFVEHYNSFYPFMLEDLTPHYMSSDAKITSNDLLLLVLCNKKEPIRGISALDKTSLMNLTSALKSEKLLKAPLHPLYEETCKFVIECFPDKFEYFYQEIIRQSFFQQNHNELASIGLELTGNLIRSTSDPMLINTLIHDHVVRLLIVSSRNCNALMPHCVKFFESLQEFFNSQLNQSEADDKINILEAKQLAILQRLTSPPATIAFDEDSKSSFLRKLVQECRPNVLRKYLEILMHSLHSKSTSTTNFETRLRVQQSCVQQMMNIVRRPQLVSDLDTITQVAKFFLLSSMFKIDASITSKSRDAFWKTHHLLKPHNFEPPIIVTSRNALHGVLNQLVSVCDTIQRLEQLNELINFVDKIFHLDGLEYRDSHQEDSKDVTDLWSTYISYLNKHRKTIAEQKGSNLLYPISSLFLLYGLQTLEHKMDFKSQLEELMQCSDEVFRADPADGTWADVITDQIIAILSATECKPWIRGLCESVFGSLLPHISQTSIDLLCDAIRTPIGDESGSDDEDSNTDEMDIDDEEMDSSQIGDDERSESVENTGSDNLECDDLEQSHSEEENKNSEAEAETESDEELLDDEQMMKLDPMLADMFKLNRISKRKADPAFQLRCLDLIKKVVIKKHSDKETIDVIMKTIVPLATSCRKSPETRPISDKIATILKKMPGGKGAERRIRNCTNKGGQEVAIA